MNNLSFKKVFKFFVLSLATAALLGALYLRLNFRTIGLDEIIFTFFAGGIKQSSISVIVNIIKGFIPIIIAIIPLIFLSSFDLGFSFEIETNIFKKRNFSIYPNNFLLNHKYVVSAILFVGAFLIMQTGYGLSNFIKNTFETTEIYENYYQDTKSVEIKFPDSKPNLIHIIVESLETSTFSYDNGGDTANGIIKELEIMAEDPENINFSNNDLIGGVQAPALCGWTVAGIICQTSGTPIKAFITNSERENFKYVPGVKALGDVLKKEGYKLEFILGSSVTFAHRDNYFKYHGNYRIHDYEYAKKTGIIDKDYYVWWGYEDRKMFKTAKTEVTKLSLTGKPFAATILTADTHFPDGYVDDECPEVGFNNYYNSYRCASTMVADFVNWVKSKPELQDTVIVITGDHLTMTQDLFTNKNRYVYNLFINSKVKPLKTKNRNITSFDIYPSILGALGAEIEGNRLGFGTNLFSEEETILEKYKIDINYLNDELAKNSKYYNKNIM